MEELIQRCPCCNSKKIIWEKSIAPETTGYYQECCDCGLRTACWASPQEALKKWNTRPTPDNIKDIEWVGECPCEMIKFVPDGQGKCRTCGGDRITRPATLEEVIEKAVELISITEDSLRNTEIWKAKFLKALTINDGTLRIKE